MKKSKLFVSFTALLRHLEEGTVEKSDLSEGLYAFACTRDHIFPSEPNYETTEVSWGKGEASRKPLLEEIKKACLLAEQENRIVWRTIEEGNMSFNKISNLVAVNGFSSLDLALDVSYSYRGVEKAIKAKNIPLEVILNLS